MTTARARWDRLAADVSAVLPVSVSSSTYPGSVTYYIDRRLPDGNYLAIHDTWWRKNADVWTGYAVTLEDSDDILTREWPRTKKRSEVVAAVREAIA